MLYFVHRVYFVFHVWITSDQLWCHVTLKIRICCFYSKDLRRLRKCVPQTNNNKSFKRRFVEYHGEYLNWHAALLLMTLVLASQFQVNTSFQPGESSGRGVLPFSAFVKLQHKVWSSNKNCSCSPCPIIRPATIFRVSSNRYLWIWIPFDLECMEQTAEVISSRFCIYGTNINSLHLEKLYIKLNSKFV